MTGKVKFTLTVETTEATAPHLEKYLLGIAARLLGRLTRVDYEDRGDYYIETRRKTLRKIGRA